MRNTFFITKNLEKKLRLRNYNKKGQLQNIIDLVKNKPESLDESPTALYGQYLYHSIQNRYNLLWIPFEKKNIRLFVLREIYNQSDYNQKLEGKEKEWTKNHELGGDEKKEIERKFENLFREFRPSELLPVEYSQYEGLRVFETGREDYVYEMPTWIDCIKRVDTYDWDDIRKILEKGNYFTNSRVFENVSYAKVDSGYTIAYRVNVTSSSSKSSNYDVYLLYVCKCSEENTYNEIISQRKYDKLSFKALKTKARRCYPSYFIIDKKAWKEIEDDEKANLVLSEQEKNTLQNVKYPFFLSGLAGSGKSTILYYLFANAYAYKLEFYNEHKLLFLCYNDNLTAKARDNVKSILRCNPAFDNVKSKFDDEKIEKEFDKSFVSFTQFLKDFLSEDELKCFSPDNNMSYELFVKKYDEYCYEKCICSSISPSLLWSIIRTYIKGMDLNYYMTPKNFRDWYQSNKECRITLDVFDAAYNLWDKWYRKYYEKGEYWDDLDLVRYVLKNNFENHAHQYSVVFCDEAQDFTKVEIDLILKLTVHSKYDLSGNENNKEIPVAFAGDPNQTINPTGFNWTQTKKIFDESFSDCLESYSEIDAPPLTMNYRSEIGIVRFANTIQSLRYAYFDNIEREKKELQEAYFDNIEEDKKEQKDDNSELQNDMPNQFLYAAFYPYEEVKDILKEKYNKANIITSGEGLKDDIEKFPELDNPDSDNKKIKLLTALGTKGDEYRAVVLLNFCSDPTYKHIRSLDVSEKSEAEHFFTKLYIAVTRAREELYIVDTYENFENFWCHFLDETKWEELVPKLNLDKDSCKMIGKLKWGKIDKLKDRLTDTYNPRENAHQAFMNAKSDRSASSMMDAYDYYIEAGCSREANLCDAYISLFSRKYEEAGDKFLHINFPQSENLALDAYWQGKCWQRLSKLKQADSEIAKIRISAARLMLDTTSDEAAVEFAKIFAEEIESYREDISNNTDNRLIWSIVFDRLIVVLGKQLKSEHIVKSLLNNLDCIEDIVGDKLTPVRAELYYRYACLVNGTRTKREDNFKEDDYQKAIQIWDSIGKSEHKNYYLAKERLSDNTPDLIYWMNKSGKNKEILSQYGDPDLAETLNFPEETRRILFLLWVKLRDFFKALSYPYESKDRLKHLYSVDSAKFLEHVVLENFTVELFNEWVEAKIKQDAHNLFTQKLPKSLFEKIFKLDKFDRFMRLRDRDERRVMKYSMNQKTIAETINRILPKRGFYFPLCLCFLDVVFNDSNFENNDSDRFSDTVIKIFEQYDLSRAYFDPKHPRDSYFTSCKLTEEEYACMRKNLAEYAKHNVEHILANHLKKINQVQTLCRIIEMTTPIEQVKDIIDWYNNLLNEGKCTEKLKTYLSIRIIVLTNLIEKETTYNKFVEDIVNDGYSLSQVITSFSNDDKLWFVTLVLKYNNIKKEDVVLVARETARFIYDCDIKHNYNDEENAVLSANTIKLVNSAVSSLMKEPRIDGDALKLIAYSLECMLDEPERIAKWYEEILQSERFSKMARLKTYMAERALYQYSLIYDDDDVMYENKCKELGLQIPRFKMQSKSKPYINTRVSALTTLPNPVQQIKEKVTIEGIDIDFNRKQKTIWFNENGIPLVTIVAEHIIPMSDKVKVDDEFTTIRENFIVKVLSSSLCRITVNNQEYEIKMQEE